MPKGPIPVGYSKVAAVGTFEEATWANIWYVDTSTSDPAYPFDAMLAAQLAIKAFYDAFGGAQLSNTWTVERFKVAYRSDESSTYTTTIADAVGGGVSGGYQDAQVGYLFNWVTGDSRRGGKPRQYVCGVPDTMISGSTGLTSSCKTALQTAINAFLAFFPVAGGAHGNADGIVEMSFVNDKVDRAVGFPMPIIAGSINPTVATQRRRVDRQRT